MTNKQKLYYIGYKHGRKRGVGVNAFYKETALSLIDKLNKEFGKGTHWLVEKEDD